MENQQYNGVTAAAGKAKTEVLDWLDTVVISVLAVVLVFTFVFRMVGISGGSMQHTLEDGDRVIIMSAFYAPRQGDIVVISRDYLADENGESPEPIIKRIIATEGQTVYIDYANDRVLVDGVALEESYVCTEDGTATSGRIMAQNPYVVEPGKVFVMGDHRLVSRDSRAADVGAIDQRYILGRAVLRVYPFNQIEVLTDD